MAKLFDVNDLLDKEYNRYTKRVANVKRQRDLIIAMNKIATIWAGKKSGYVYSNKRHLKRYAEVEFDATDGEVKLRLTLTKSDSLKMLEPLLWQFLDDFKYHYMSKKYVDYYHKNDLTILAIFEHSSYCKMIPTGKMIPETKIECG